MVDIVNTFLFYLRKLLALNEVLCLLFFLMPVLAPGRPPVQWVTVALSLKLGRPGRVPDDSP
jgi:hypothetical protein